jgi:hypothetical protein
MFNKQLTEEKYNEMKSKIAIDFRKVSWTNHLTAKSGFELKTINSDNPKEAWRPVREQLECLTKLEIWDDEANEVVLKITGWDLNKEFKQDSATKQAIELLKKNGFKIIKE